MYSEIDRKTYEFIREYAEENGDEAPSYAVVADAVDGFEYIPEVSDSYTYLARQIKDFTAQRAVVGWFESGEFERKLNELGGKKFVEEWLPSVLESVKMRTDVRESVGTDVKKDGDKVHEDYERRKAGEACQVCKTTHSAIAE